MAPCITARGLRNGNLPGQEQPAEEDRIVVLVQCFDYKISFTLPLVADECQKMCHPTINMLLTSLADE